MTRIEGFRMGNKIGSATKLASHDGRTPRGHLALDCKQMRVFARQERMGGDLTLEAGGPAAGDCSGACGTMAVRREAVIFDQVAVALDHSCFALGTASVFPFTDSAGKISGIDVAPAGLASDFNGAQQIFGGGVARVGHLIVAVEGSDVP